MGPYEIDGVLGRGGAGVVYRARDPAGRPVAVKCIAVRDDRAARRLLREAGVRIAHRNVVRVLGAGVDVRGDPYVVTELLEGISLGERIEQGCPVDELLELMAQAADGLAALHAAGVIHRDVKPSNLFVTRDGTIKLLDFGAANFADASTILTHPGSLIGTPAYLSPEQARGGAVDGRSDVWGLAMCLYYALTGHLPFRRASVLSTALAVQHDPLPPLADRAPRVPSALASLVQRCLARRPEERVQAAAELADLLRAVRQTPEEPTPARADDEWRSVAVVVLDQCANRDFVDAQVEVAGGFLMPIFTGSAVAVLGGGTAGGNELENAVELAREIAPACRAAIVGKALARHGGREIAGQSLDALFDVLTRGASGLVLTAEAARVAPASLSLQLRGDGTALAYERRAITRRASADVDLPPVQLGPFVLEGSAVRGGMALVFRARHPDGTRAAIKIPVVAGASAPRFVAAFHDEARATAALDHRAVVRLYDYGVVTPEAEVASRGVLRAGLPWIAMEWASGGTLAHQDRPKTWNDVVSTLLTILDALGHVHARGIVHRDLKPANVLVCTAEDGAAGLRLTDFGFVLGPGSTARLRGGTPAYMAPEQWEERERDQGPWTDLYGLGVLAWRMVTDSLPDGAVGPFTPLIPVPGGFETWLRTMLAWSPRARFRSASDAAYALVCLGPTPERVTSRSGEDALRDAATPTLTSPSARRTATASTRVSTDGATHAATVPKLARAPLPASWRASAHRTRPYPANVGRGVVHLRPVPIAGRERERDILWSALTEAISDAQPRAVILVGGAGLGKTRLLEWLLHRAVEIGAAEALLATHHASHEHDDGIVAMLARALRVEGLDAVELAYALAEKLPDLTPHDRRSVVTLLSGDTPLGSTRPEERRMLVARALASMNRERPLIVGLDDVQWNEEAIELAEDLLEYGPDRCPLLLVLAARDDALAEHHRARAAMSRVLADVRATQVSLEPLSPEDHGELVRHLLGLDATVALSIEARTAGNPAFAIELVVDWLRGGLLEPGPEGFRLRYAAPDIPADLAATWRARADRVLASRSEDDARAVEIAALLGETCDPEEWDAACVAAGVRREPDLVDVLADERLVHRLPGDRWSFAHGMLREALLALAGPGVAREHHQACITALRGRKGQEARLGRHLLHAGAPEEAIPPLLTAIDRAATRGDYVAMASALADAETASASLPASSILRGEVRLRGVMTARVGKFDRAMEECQALIADHARYGWGSLGAEARAQLSDMCRQKGDLPGALAALDRAEAETTSGATIAGIRRRRAYALADAGNLGEASAIAATVVGDPRASREDQVWARLLSGHVLRLRGHPREAAVALEDALARADGLRWQQAVTLGALGDALRAAGDLEGATLRYQEAIAHYRSLAPGDVPALEINLALVLMARGRWTETRQMVDRIAADLERRGRLPLVALALSVGLPARAARGEWAELDADATRVEELLVATGYVERDFVLGFDHAAQIAASAGETARAERLRALADAQEQALDGAHART